MREAQSHLDKFIQEHGPFDGVFGFSLGAALAISYMLDPQRKDASPPFSFAVFFSPIFIASPNESYCEELLQRWLDDEHVIFRSEFPEGDFMPLLEDPTERILAQYLQLVLAMQAMGVGMILPNTTVDFLGAGEVQGIPRLIHPDLLPDRIRIPTVHVTGLKDSPYIGEQSRIAQGLCSPSIRQVHHHDGGHDVPYKRSDVTKIISSIKTTAKEGQNIRDLYEL